MQSPDNPLKPAGVPANLNGSKGLEGMALDLRGKTLYALLAGALLDDPLRTRLLINEFDLKSRAWTGARFAYRLESPAHAIGEFTAIGNRLFLVIERDNNQGAAAEEDLQGRPAAGRRRRLPAEGGGGGRRQRVRPAARAARAAGRRRPALSPA